MFRFYKIMIFLFLTVVSLHAEKLVYFEGIVSVLRSGENIEVETGMILKERDLIETESDSFAVIELIDRGNLKLRSNTQIELSSLTLNTSVKVNHGGLFSKIKKIIFGGYTVTTPTTAAGVRGTEFFIAYGKTIDESPDIWLCVNEGSVLVEIRNTNHSVIVDKGKGITIPGGKVLTKPVFYPWTEKLNWNSDPEAGTVKDSTDLNSAYEDLLDHDYD